MGGNVPFITLYSVQSVGSPYTQSGEQDRMDRSREPELRFVPTKPAKATAINSIHCTPHGIESCAVQIIENYGL